MDDPFYSYGVTPPSQRKFAMRNGGRSRLAACHRRYLPHKGGKAWCGLSPLSSLVGRPLWMLLLLLGGGLNLLRGPAISASATSSPAAAKSSLCGRRFVVHVEHAGDRKSDSLDNSRSGGTNAEKAPADETKRDGALSRGRGFMGAAMVDDPTVVIFAGGIGRDGTMVDSDVDAFSIPTAIVDGAGDAMLVNREVISLQSPRTDMGAGSTTRALYFAGGCGVPTSSHEGASSGDNGTSNNEPEEEGGGALPVEQAGDDAGGQGDGDGDAEESVPDMPLLVKNCQATDIVDVLVPGQGPEKETQDKKGSKSGRESFTVAADSVRLCESKYAATVGVFYTGTPDDGNPSRWSPTAHVLVAGGIIPTGDGTQYTATDTVDILREEGIDDVTGKARITKLPIQRLPYPPRFEMSSCCFKHQCVFAGGRVSMGSGGTGFNSDRADVWDGATWSFVTWGEHTLSEPRHLMGSAVIELTLGETKRTVGVFAGGISNAGDSPMVDMFDFGERRVLPRIYAPTVSGRTQGVSLSRDVAAFVSETGKIDVFDGKSLCWMSFRAEGFLPGTSVVGRSPSWFFNETSPGFQSSGDERAEDPTVEEAYAFVGGGVLSMESVDVSRDVQELRLRRTRKGKGHGVEACLGGTVLPQLQKICGLPGPEGSIQSFTPHGEDRDTEPKASRKKGRKDVRFGGDGGVTSAGASAGRSKLWLYALAALAGILVSYLASATFMLRRAEGIWRMPCGGGVLEALCEAPARCCGCCCGPPLEESRTLAKNGQSRTAAGEGSRLLNIGDVEAVPPMGGKGNLPPPSPLALSTGSNGIGNGSGNGIGNGGKHGAKHTRSRGWGVINGGANGRSSVRNGKRDARRGGRSGVGSAKSYGGTDGDSLETHARQQALEERLGGENDGDEVGGTNGLASPRSQADAEAAAQSASTLAAELAAEEEREGRDPAE